MAKSFSLYPFNEMGKNHFGLSGTLVLAYFAGLLPAPAYTRKIEKSPVCLGHSQLSVSPPNFPTASGGAPTKRISLYVLYVYIKYWLSLNILYTLPVKPLSLSNTLSVIAL